MQRESTKLHGRGSPPPHTHTKRKRALHYSFNWNMVCNTKPEMLSVFTQP